MNVKEAYEQCKNTASFVVVNMNRNSNPFSNGNLIDLKGGETDAKEISEVQNTLKYVCSKLEELGRDNFMLKGKVKDHEKYIADLTNRIESQEITINQLEQKINDAELSVEDMRLRSPVPNQVRFTFRVSYHDKFSL